MVLPIKHPIAKTATELRRSVERLEAMIQRTPDEPYVKDGSVERVIVGLNKTLDITPKEFRD